MSPGIELVTSRTEGRALINCATLAQTTSPKLPGTDYIVKNWALAMMLQALLLVHFWSIIIVVKEQMMTSIRKALKMVV